MEIKITGGITHYYPTAEDVINTHKELMEQWEMLGKNIEELQSKFAKAINILCYANNAYETYTEEGKAFEELTEINWELIKFSRYFN